MDVPEEPLQRVLLVDCVGPGGMKKHVHGPDRLPHSVGYGQAGLGYLWARVVLSLVDHVHECAH